MKEGSYSRGFLVRCLIIGAASQSEGKIDWNEVSVSVVRQAPPDQTEVLACFDAKLSAAQLSQLCFLRSDWALFVPMFGCLWREAHERWGATELQDIVASSMFYDLAKAYAQRWGFGAHPVTLVQQFLQASVQTLA